MNRTFAARLAAHVFLFTAACVPACLLIAGRVAAVGGARTSPDSGLLPPRVAARVAVLDFGETVEARRAADVLAASLSPKNSARGDERVIVIDRDLSRAAARGAGYAGSLNLTLREARDLGAAVDCDFLVLGDAQVIRRSSSAAPVYFEAYASVMVVSTRTGRLILWDRPAAEASAPDKSSALLLEQLRERARARYAPALLAARESEERDRREITSAEATAKTPMLDLSAEDSTQGAVGGEADVRPPQPYRRLRPPYPEAAARAEIEATVDVLVDLNEEGQVTRAEVSRWAGFGLDESVTDTVRRMHFRPAKRGNQAVSSRVLLRYNFRRPPRQAPPN